MKQKLIILGAGESGIGAAILGLQKGYDVFVSDSENIAIHFKEELQDKSIPFEENGHSENKVFSADLIVKSPGISEQTDIIQQAIKHRIAIISEIEFASTYTEKPIIAITGSNGKTTTTLLIHHLLTKNGIDAAIGGNIGKSFARLVCEDKYELYVIEVSSFQLDGIESFKPDVAILLNITPDHLDRYHHSFESYIKSKMRITKNLTPDDLLVWNMEDPQLQKQFNIFESCVNQIPVSFQPVERCKAFVQSNSLVVQLNDQYVNVPVSCIPLKGKHNVLNTLAAIVVASHFGLSQEQIIKGISSFKNAPHRLEYITEINGVDFINDTKATNVDAVFYALGSYDSPIIWIAGGQDKGNNYDQIKNLAIDSVKALVCLGADNEKLITYFSPLIDDVSETDDVKVAARMALDYANKNDVVLLSPACASFDLFDNYEQRGDRFKEAVIQLKKELYEKA